MAAASGKKFSNLVSMTPTIYEWHDGLPEARGPGPPAPHSRVGWPFQYELLVVWWFDERVSQGSYMPNVVNAL